MADTADEDNLQIDCPLHKCIFEDDYRKLSQLIRTHDVGQKDKHGKHWTNHPIVSPNAVAAVVVVQQANFKSNIEEEIQTLHCMQVTLRCICTKSAKIQ